MRVTPFDCLAVTLLFWGLLAVWMAAGLGTVLVLAAGLEIAYQISRARSADLPAEQPILVEDERS